MRFGKRRDHEQAGADGGDVSGALGTPTRLVEVFDAYGRPYSIDAEVWRTQVLPDSLRHHWDSPDELARDVSQGLRDGFASDVLAAAEHLHEIDPARERAAILFAVCLIEVGNLAAAESILRDLLLYTDSAAGWTNLAKIDSLSGRDAEARVNLLRSLDADPNYDNALMWLAAIAKESEGDSGWLKVMADAAQRDGSWRAQLWLGRASLNDGDLHGALAWYRQAMDRAPDEPGVLMMVSGDLGNAGKLDELIGISFPVWRPEVHGLDAGRNLLEAALQSGRIEVAEDVLHRIHMLQLPNLPTHMRAYEDRLDELRAQRLAAMTDPLRDQPSVALLSGPDPIWWRPLAQPHWALDPPRAGVVVGLTQLWTQSHSTEVAQQKTEWRGRVARGTPWYLADLLRFNGIQTIVSLPVLVGRGMVLTGARDSDDSLRRVFAEAEPKPTIIVTGEVSGTDESPTVVLEFLDAELLTPLLPQQPPVGLADLDAYFAQVLNALGTPCLTGPVPSGDLASRAISGYEMVLNLVAIARGLVPSDAYWAERRTLNFLLELAVEEEAGDTAAFLYLSALVANRGRGENIYAEFEKRTDLMFGARGVDGRTARMQPLASVLFDRPDLRPSGQPDFDSWLEGLSHGLWYPPAASE